MEFVEVLEMGNGSCNSLKVHQQKSKFNKRILIDITGTTGRFLGVTTSISCNLTKNTLTIYFFLGAASMLHR